MSVDYPTSGGAGLKTYKNDALKATKATVKSGRSRLYGFSLYNPDASFTFVQVFDALEDNVTVGTTASKTTFAVPATSQVTVMFPYPVEFNTGIVVAAATTATGNTAQSTGLLTNLYYV